MNLGEKIRNARIAKRMPQSELARLTGVSLRTIQHYESGQRMPKRRDTYDKLASALGIEARILLDENTDFVLQAGEQYGSRGAKQAWEMVEELTTMWSGGKMEDEDMDEIMQALQAAYWDAKKKNRKYVNKRYREGDSSAD